MRGSSIPDATDALVARFTAAAIANLEVFDGPEFNPEGDFISVGWTDRQRVTPTTSGTSQSADFGLSEGIEAYDVLHLLRVWASGEPFKDTRRRIFTYLQQLTIALAQDYTLGGAVMQAWVTSYELTPFLNADGGYVDLVFTVSCHAAR